MAEWLTTTLRANLLQLHHYHQRRRLRLPTPTTSHCRLGQVHGSTGSKCKYPLRGSFEGTEVSFVKGCPGYSQICATKMLQIRVVKIVDTDGNATEWSTNGHVLIHALETTKATRTTRTTETTRTTGTTKTTIAIKRFSCFQFSQPPTILIPETHAAASRKYAHLRLAVYKCRRLI